ncbi:MAG TPA: MarR family transcriptional regulator [Chthonomonadaceae bacterium]|nr:MarR family transcriptional regulator [Chthonomonadaceae bacterium]
MPTILRRLFTIGQSGPLADMPLAQLRICSFLQDGPKSMSSVAEELAISTSAVTQLADRMERSGLVERVAAPCDRRLKHLRLTPRAEQMMSERRASRTGRARDALVMLPAQQRDDLIEALEQLLKATIATGCPVEAAS